MIEIVKIFGHSGAEKRLIKSTREFGFHCRCFDDISKEEISLKNEYEASYPTELNKVEAETKFLETEIDNFERTIESKSLEIKDDFCVLVKNIEEEIH